MDYKTHVQDKRITRGRGLLEPLLARWRSNQANRLIPNTLRSGRILDIGCGSYPYFLSHTYFKEKFAVEQFNKPEAVNNISWYTMDLNCNHQLPFENQYFNVVTMLAVVEHLDPSRLVFLCKEIYRLLQPRGVLVITTPAAWSDNLLHWLARINMVSSEEINEHAYAYTLPLLGWYFGRAGFEMAKVHFGYFEMMLNMWAVAER